MPGKKFLSSLAKAYDGDPTVFGGPACSPVTAGRLRAAQVELIHRYTPWMMLACVANATIVVASMWGSPQFLQSVLWALAVCLTAAAMYNRWWQRRTMVAPATISVRAVHRTIGNAVVFSILWGLVPVLFFSSSVAATDLVIVCICAGMMCGAALALATVPAAALVATLGQAICIGIALLLAGDSLHVMVAVLLMSYTAVIIKSSIVQANTFAARMLSHFQSEQQREVIGMLLCDFEENASDWLWETDARARLVHASSRLADVLGCPAEALAGKAFGDLLEINPATGSAAARRDRDDLLARLTDGIGFRELVIPVMVRGERRLWSLTGKPIRAKNGALEGFRGVGADVTEAREAEEQIRHLARHDALTGLPNRLLFGEELGRCLARLSQSQEPFALLCLDLDHMKEVNDSWGHAGGDAMLVEVAARVKGQLRPGDICGRIGGDEFAILLAGAATREAISPLAEKIVQSLAMPFSFNGGSLTLGGSIGIAMAPADGMEADTLLKSADMAMYRTKRSGRGAFHFFEADMDARARARRQMETDLRSALQKNEFRLYYQPLIDVHSGKITGSEALLRWQHPVHGLVMPLDFVPLAEDMGLIVPIGEWVIRQACRDAVSWPADIRVAVNLSAVQFRSPGLVAVVMSALAQSGLDARRLEVEVTESVLVSESQTACAILDTLRLLGVRTALDDFGTGYSSLTYLRQMPFDKIKIDRSFINDLLTHADSAAIVHALIGLAGGLKMSITAEGVETQAQLTHLREQGCGEAQGYLIGRPTPSDGLVALLEAQGDSKPVARVGVAA